jgi:hypothetical protein
MAWENIYTSRIDEIDIFEIFFLIWEEISRHKAIKNKDTIY